ARRDSRLSGNEQVLPVKDRRIAVIRDEVAAEDGMPLALVEIDTADELVFVAVIDDPVLQLAARVGGDRNKLGQIQRLLIKLRGRDLVADERRLERNRRRCAGARQNGGEVAG